MDQRRKPQPVDPGIRAAVIGAAVGKWVAIRFLRGPVVDEAHGWLGICEDSGEVVVEGDGGATFIRIPTLISIEMDA